MESISHRIADCIDKSGLTKTAFAEKLNMSQSFVSRLASGEKIPSDRTIADICDKFNISDTWLRTGEGERLVQLNEDEEFDRICAQIQISNDGFIKSIIKKYWGLDENGKIVIRQMLSGL